MAYDTWGGSWATSWANSWLFTVAVIPDANPQILTALFEVRTLTALPQILTVMALPEVRESTAR